MLEQIGKSNTMPEGFTFRGLRHSQESRAKMSQAHLGIPHSQAHRDKISAALRNKPRAKEVVEKLSTVWKIVRPLVLRGGVPMEIEEVTEFTRQQIKMSIGRERLSLFSAPTTPQQTKEARKRSHILSWRERKGNFSEGHRKISEIAKTLVREDYFTDNLQYFKRLKDLYRMEKREWPEDFSLRLCCEAYFVSRMDILENKNRDMLGRYVNIVQGLRKDNEPLCPKTLIEEQVFIISAVNSKPL